MALEFHSIFFLNFLQDEDNEENNLIPFSDVPHGDPATSASGSEEPETIPDREITVINLQKENTKQNFKGFVDTDLIDDNLRLVEETPETEAPVPLPVPVPASPPPFIPTPLQIPDEPTSSSPSAPSAPTTTAPLFIPTSLPSLVPNTETLNTEVAPETDLPTEDETAQPTGELHGLCRYYQLLAVVRVLREIADVKFVRTNLTFAP